MTATVWRLMGLGALVCLAVLLVWRFDPRQLPLGVCTFHGLTGLHCPGCGATRASHDLLHGQWLSALRHNALWVLALPLVVYVAASEVRRRLWDRALPGDLLRSPRFLAAVAIAAVVFGILRNIPFVPFVLLAPPG